MDAADTLYLQPRGFTGTAQPLFTAMPAYDVSLFFDQLQAGNLLAAIGDPIAADLGWIFTIASSFV